MANVFDYLIWRGDLSLSAAPFQRVDALILTCLSYAPLDGLVPPEGISLRAAAESYFTANGWPEEKRRADFEENTLLFWAALARSVRFGGMRLKDYVNQIDPEKEQQFSAVTVELGEAGTFAAFRGTDNTLVGWKEDFNMGYCARVPSQQAAAVYLERTAALSTGPLWAGGHSKGGNLAVYAAANCSPAVRARLAGVYNNDGPGFCGNALDRAGYEAVRGRIHTFVPQTSVVGMLLDHEEEYTVVCSDQTGILQHDPYSWQLKGPDFGCLEEVDGTSRFVSLTLKEWIAGLDGPRRAEFVDALFEVLSAAGEQVSPLPTLTPEWFRQAGAVLDRLRTVDRETRHIIFQVLGELLKAAQRNVPELIGAHLVRREEAQQ